MKFGWRGALGIALSVALLVWAFWGVDLREVTARISAANPWLLGAAALCSTLIFPLRARRWQTILEPVAGTLPVGMLWRATAIGMMINNVVGLRAGEPARAYALTKETPRVGFAASFASLAVDRVFDSVTVLLLMVVAILSPAFPSEAEILGRSVSSYAIGFSVIAAAAAVLLYLIVFFPAGVVRMFEAVVRRTAPRLEARGRTVLLSFAGGLGVLRRPRLFASVFLWTLAHWLLNAFAFWLGFRALGIASPFSAAMMLQGIIAIGVAAPSAPGFFGVFEGFAIVGLALYGVDQTTAVTWAIAYHFVSYIPITGIGAYYIARLNVHLSDVRKAAERST
jgi:hypothetical protein